MNETSSPLSGWQLICWRGALLASAPVVIGVCCLFGHWIFYLTPAGRWASALQIWQALAVTSRLMIWVGPLSTIVAMALTEVGQIRGWRRIVCFVVNGIWFFFSLPRVLQFLTWR